MAKPDSTEPTGKPEEILSDIIDSLKQDESTDVSLLEIVYRHIVTISPETGAVDAAMAAIETLTASRGNKVD